MMKRRSLGLRRSRRDGGEGVLCNGYRWLIKREFDQHIT